MASAAMYKQQQLHQQHDASAHQSNGITSNRHHLSDTNGDGLNYDQNQYNTSYQEHTLPRVLIGPANSLQVETYQNQHQPLQQADLQQTSVNNEPHYYYSQSSANAVAAAAVAVAQNHYNYNTSQTAQDPSGYTTTNDYHHYELADGYNSHYPFAQQPYTSELIENQTNIRQQNYPHSIDYDQGRLTNVADVSGANLRTRTVKIDNSEDQISKSIKETQIDNEAVLTELGPKCQFRNGLASDEAIEAARLKNEEVQDLQKKRKKLSRTVRELENYSQLESSFNIEHHHQSSSAYLNLQAQRPQTNSKSPISEEYQWRNNHERTDRSSNRIDQSSTGSLRAFVTNNCAATTTENNGDNFKHQLGYSLQLAAEDQPASNSDSNHLLARYSTASRFSNDEDELKESTDKQDNGASEYNQLRILEMRKEKSRDAARSRRSKENHEFYELAKLLPLPAAITSQLDFLDKASIIRLTISFLKLRQFSVNGHPPWAPDFTTLGSINPYSSQSLTNYAENYSSNASQDDTQSRPTSVGVNKQGSSSSQTIASSSSASYSSDRSSSILQPSSVAFTTPVPLDPYHQPDRALSISDKSALKNSASLFEVHQGTHILQSLDGFAFAIGRDGRFLYISETVSMYLGLSQVEMTGSSVFDYAHQQDHEELAKQLGLPYSMKDCNQDSSNNQVNSGSDSPAPTSVHSQYSAASNETLIEDYVNPSCRRKRLKPSQSNARGAYGARGNGRRTTHQQANKQTIKIEASTSDVINSDSLEGDSEQATQSERIDPNNRIESKGTVEDPLVRQFCIRMKSTLTKRGCQHFKSSGYRVVHVIAHLRSYQSNDHGHLMDPLDECEALSGSTKQSSKKKGSLKLSNKELTCKETSKSSNDNINSDNKQLIARSGEKQKIIGMVAVAIALPPPSINELRLESGTFVLKLSLDLKVTHIEPKITELLHYPIELIVGRSLYSLIHPADIHQVQKCHKDLLKKGQMMSGYYRLLARDGGYIWIQTCATLICNNTFASQAPALPNSPMPNNSSNQANEHHKSIPNYLAAQATTTPMADIASNQYASGAKTIVSPGLSSHLSSNYDQQDQDQCVIFVNYMITDIIDSEEILDVCQSQNYTPLSSTFSGNPNNNNIGDVSFNSPSSSCSSPCLGSLKANYGSNSSYNASSPRRSNQSESKAMRLSNGRQRIATTSGVVNSNKAQIYSNLSHNENGNFCTTGQVKLDGINSHQLVESLASTSEQQGSISTPIYSYSQAPGSVNLALNKTHGNGNESSTWLAHQPTTGLLNDASVVYGACQTTNHYSSMNRSIYKAAFGLGATNYNQQHPSSATSGSSAEANYNSVERGNSTNYASSAAAPTTTNTWDTAAVAAVAAASNLTNHHHATNPYAHLEPLPPHHHHQMSSAAAAANHHHSSANTYYNYYSYYGNKFI